jgi:hypothetical protein
MLVITDKLGHQAVDDHQELDFIFIPQLLDNFDHAILQAYIQCTTSFKDEFLWVRVTRCHLEE